MWGEAGSAAQPAGGAVTAPGERLPHPAQEQALHPEHNHTIFFFFPFFHSGD